MSQIWSDGISRVLLSNDNQTRVLVYDHLPLTPDTASPDRLLGQTTWTGTSANDGSASVNARGFGQAAGACFNGTTLYVRDNGNSRVLGWRGWPTQMGQAADFVLGQPDFASSTPNSGGISKASLSLGIDSGNSLDCRGGHLVMADTGNHRVLVWNVAPTKNGVPADIVLGQSSGDQGAAGGAGGVGAGGFLLPGSAATLDGGGGRTAIVVADGTANRVVEWDDIPAVDGAPFDRVYGQPDRTTTSPNTGGLSTGSLDSPAIVTADDENRFWVGDFGNGRALRFDLDSPAAIGVFGQRSGSSTEIYPGTFSVTHTGWAHFWKGELSLDPTSGLFTTCVPARDVLELAAARRPYAGIDNPGAAGRDDLPSAAARPRRPRSKVTAPPYASAAACTGATPTASSRCPARSRRTTRFPTSCWATRTSRATPSLRPPSTTQSRPRFSPPTDRSSSRSTVPASSGGTPRRRRRTRPSTSPIGQPSLLVDTANNGGVSAGSLGAGRNALTVYERKLIVADPANNRVLIWNAIPSSTGVPADIVSDSTTSSRARRAPAPRK